MDELVERTLTEAVLRVDLEHRMEESMAERVMVGIEEDRVLRLKGGVGGWMDG